MWLTLLLQAVACASFTLQRSHPCPLQFNHYPSLASSLQLLFSNPIWRKTILLVRDGTDAFKRLQLTVASMMMAGEGEAVDMKGLEMAIITDDVEGEEVLRGLLRLLPKEIQVTKNYSFNSN